MSNSIECKVCAKAATCYPHKRQGVVACPNGKRKSCENCENESPLCANGFCQWQPKFVEAGFTGIHIPKEASGTVLSPAELTAINNAMPPEAKYGEVFVKIAEEQDRRTRATDQLKLDEALAQRDTLIEKLEDIILEKDEALADALRWCEFVERYSSEPEEVRN
jgi:hypothetical protein